MSRSIIEGLVVDAVNIQIIKDRTGLQSVRAELESELDVIYVGLREAITEHLGEPKAVLDVELGQPDGLDQPEPSSGVLEVTVDVSAEVTQPSAREVLEHRATAMGINHAPNWKDETLERKIEEAMALRLTAEGFASVINTDV